MIVQSVVPIVKDAILELRELGKSDEEIRHVLMKADNLDMLFSEAEMEMDRKFGLVDHIETFEEAFRQVAQQDSALFAHPGARGMKTHTKLMIAGGAALAAGVLAYWLRGDQTSFLVPPPY